MEVGCRKLLQDTKKWKQSALVLSQPRGYDHCILGFFAVWTWLEAPVQVRQRGATKRTWSSTSVVETEENQRQCSLSSHRRDSDTLPSRSNPNKSTARSEIPDRFATPSNPAPFKAECRRFAFSSLPTPNSEGAILGGTQKLFQLPHGLASPMGVFDKTEANVAFAQRSETDARAHGNQRFLH